MWHPADMNLWHGRVDKEELTPAFRWHERISPWNEASAGTVATDSAAPVLVGFASEEGVIRNQGRPGAKEGPRAIRQALAGLSYPLNESCFDAGDIACVDNNLEQAQAELGNLVCRILKNNQYPVVLGGGHEVAWGSFLGLHEFLSSEKNPRLGIINLDAHFDLRNPEPLPSSGTPFRQIAWHCQHQNQPFQYCVLGINPSVNTAALFDFAQSNNVMWLTDLQCAASDQQQAEAVLEPFISSLDYLYITVCLDVFPSAWAPGVSAPAALGVTPDIIFRLINQIKYLVQKHSVKWLMSDIAELNPLFDIDNRTARLAARVVHELMPPGLHSITHTQ